ncbi:MAG: FHA domain-containing protein [Chloroflexota bacterium]|nr:MAG: FHA domain-containing protein [Chloroflexota bacterium]
MCKRFWRSGKLLFVLVALAAWLLWPAQSAPVAAQEGVQPEGDRPIGRLVISSADASSAPTIVLHAYAVDGQGAPVNLNAQNVIVTHDGRQVSDVETVAGYEAGTFTIFVVDIPPGVEPQLEAIQQAVQQYASPPELQEPSDYVTIYQVGEDEAAQLLAPANFYNAIRNFFAEPLVSQSGPTALLDSLGALLDEADSLKPEAGMATSVVLITDGTDVVSRRFEASDIAIRAGALGIPIHTIWVENQNLQPFSHQGGQDYLSELAQATGGLYSQLDQAEGLAAIWERIADFRTHSTIQYRPESLSGGTFDVVLSMRDDPEVQDTTSVTVPDTAPSVIINLPAESRQLALENLEEPVALSFSTTVTWLDEVEREITSAQLLVNGAVAQEIDVRDLDQFRAEITNFSFGPNTVQVAVEDELGQQATSPAIVLNVAEGETQVPEALESRSQLAQNIARFALGCFVLLLIVALVGLAVFLVRRRRSSSRQRRDYGPPASESPPPTDYRGPEIEPARQGQLYLEVLDAVTRTPPTIDLTAAEHRIGRNPSQADIVFENDITVSRIHASLMLEGSDYRLYDEASSSGTYANDQPVPEYGYQLLDGDEIRLGAVLLRYRRG